MNTSLSKLLRKVPAAIIAFSVVFMSFPAQPVAAAEGDSNIMIGITLQVEGPALKTDFTVILVNAGNDSFVASQPIEESGDTYFFNVQPGTYRLETSYELDDTYVLSFPSDTDSCSPDGTITVEEGDGDGPGCSLLETITEESETVGYLRTASDAVNNNGGTWLGQEGVVLKIDGEIVADDEVLALPPGLHKVEANEIPGYKLEYVGDCDEEGNVDLEAWDVEENGEFDPEESYPMSCYAHYDDIAPKVTVIKHVVDQFGEDPVYGDLTASHFTLEVRNVFFDGESTSTNEIRLQGSETGTSTNELWAGHFEVRESEYIREIDGDDSNEEHGYSPNFSDEDNNSEGYICSGELAIGQEVTCVVTNYPRLLPTETIRIKKNVINDDGGNSQPYEFLIAVEMSMYEGDVSHTEYVIGLENGYTVEVPVGASYTVTESPYYAQLNQETEEFEESDRLHRYTASYAGSCSGTIVEPEEEEEDGFQERFENTFFLNAAEEIEEPTCVITNDDPEPAPAPQGGGNGVPPPIPQNLPPHGFADGSQPSGSSSSTGGEVLGTKEDAPTTQETIDACRAEDPDTILINMQLNEMLVKLGLSRDESAEKKFNSTIVPRVLPAGASDSERGLVQNFTTYGPNSIMFLGAGERAGVVASYVQVYGHLPKTECDWQNVLRIAKGQIPVVISPTHEAELMADFAKIYGRSADRAQQMDNVTLLIMSYGLRPRVRSLMAERQAIVIFRRIYGHNPASTREWDIMRGIAYGGLQVPGSAAIVR